MSPLNQAENGERSILKNKNLFNCNIACCRRKGGTKVGDGLRSQCAIGIFSELSQESFVRRVLHEWNSTINQTIDCIGLI